jgi:carbamoyltransferase
MNVKANKVIMEMEEVESVFVFPSCGDESNAIGACYNIEAETTGTDQLSKLDNLYFGISFSNEEIKQAFDSYSFELKYKINETADIETETAKLLSDGNVVARFKGREEFGARSLGNRAILANPSRPEVVKEINKLIKNRDFWMPFAASIIDTDIEKYVDMNPKNEPYYMVMTYDTHEASSEIAAGIHPYDKTVRPQKVTQENSPEYWELINEFRNITGICGLLNTSLNLHGLPLVHRPEDAFHVMEKSSLKYLAIGDYLIEKI